MGYKLSLRQFNMLNKVKDYDPAWRDFSREAGDKTLGELIRDIHERLDESHNLLDALIQTPSDYKITAFGNVDSLTPGPRVQIPINGSSAPYALPVAGRIEYISASLSDPILNGRLRIKIFINGQPTEGSLTLRQRDADFKVLKLDPILELEAGDKITLEARPANNFMPATASLSVSLLIIIN